MPVTMQACIDIDGEFVACEVAKTSVFGRGLRQAEALRDLAPVGRGRFCRVGDPPDA